MVDNDEDLADKMVREMSIANFANEARLKEEMQKLPEYYADILRFHFFKKMTPKEITKHVPLSVYQIESRIPKALNLLREAMNPNFFPNMLNPFRRKLSKPQ
jgi:DNA-directed RNA polymerase specialized sigma subunit